MPIFAALSPLAMSIALNTGPGPWAMEQTATAYRAIAQTMTVAVGCSEAHTAALAANWKGDTSNGALSAYRRHTAWLQQQADIANQVAVRCDAQAAAYMQARAIMPRPEAIIANRARAASLAVGSTMAGASAAAFAINEAEYMVMRALAAAAMAGYEAESQANAASLPPPIPPPAITSASGGGMVPPLTSLLPGSGANSSNWAPGARPASSVVVARSSIPPAVRTVARRHRAGAAAVVTVAEADRPMAAVVARPIPVAADRAVATPCPPMAVAPGRVTPCRVTPA